ncbi:MAG: PDZ domain-containing protein, partial [Planctomycetota bacterium]
MQRDDASSFDSEADSPVEPLLPDELFLPEESTPPPGRRPRRPALVWPVLLGVGFGVALGWPLEKGTPSGPGALLAKVLRLVQDRYVEPVDSDDLVHRGIDEMLQTLDPNSRYISPEKVTEFEADTDGFFVGIGVVIEPARGEEPPQLQAVVPDSPAGRAGLQHRDRLLEIDGVDVRLGTLAEVSQRLEGPPGSSVSLLIERPTGEESELMTT